MNGDSRTKVVVMSAELHRQVKAFAALHGQSMADFVEEAIKAKMQSEGHVLAERSPLYDVHPPASP